MKKIVKIIIAIMLAIIFSFITRHYLSVINASAVGEFTAIPHFFTDTELSYKFSLLLIFLVYVLLFTYLMAKKYFNFAITGVGIIVAVLKYKEVTETYLPVDMVFIPALLELAKTLCVFMAIGIVVQWIVDGGLTAVRLVNKKK